MVLLIHYHTDKDDVLSNGVVIFNINNNNLCLLNVVAVCQIKESMQKEKHVRTSHVEHPVSVYTSEFYFSKAIYRTYSTYTHI